MDNAIISNESNNKIKDIKDELEIYQESMTIIFERLNLPYRDIFVPVKDRKTIFANIEALLEGIEVKDREKSYYISKFLAAVSCGLFDAALNYMWDETISILRKKIKNYDMDYFFDQLQRYAEKRTKKEIELDSISDQDLIEGAMKIELISEEGYKQLDLIRYMRNYASAAHPNQNELDAFQLMGWFKVLIKEVILITEPNIVVNIKQLLNNIKVNRIETEKQAKEVTSFLGKAPKIQINNLCRGLFGIYTRLDTNQVSIDNIKILLPYIWDFVDDDTKSELGIKYANFITINDKNRAEKAKEFLSICHNGLQFLTDNIKIIEIEEILDELYETHYAFDNFYNEPFFARKLERIVGDMGVPKEISKKYVLILINVAITNGNGVSINADPIYFKLIRDFDAYQTSIAILSFNDKKISSKLNIRRCKEKFIEIISILQQKTVDNLEKELIENILGFTSTYDNLKIDSNIKRIVKMIESKTS